MKQPMAANDKIAQKPDPLSRGATLLRLEDVMLATSIGSSTIYRKIVADQFPRPLRLGPGTIAVAGDSARFSPCATRRCCGPDRRSSAAPPGAFSALIESERGSNLAFCLDAFS